MNPEVRQCQNCKQGFTIGPEDFDYLKKISSSIKCEVPPPSWCPECRMTRRLSFQNVWNLYWRNCDKCGEKTLSTFPEGKKNTVYCEKCWWADDWDGTEYALDYDPSKPFLEQVKELIDRTPYVALDNQFLTLKNSDFVNGVAWSKDCYMVKWADYCDTVFFSSMLNGLKYSSDCLRMKDSELCYEDVSCFKCYQCFFSVHCHSSVDIWFSRNCYSCNSCIGCVNLRGESYCIFNKRYTKEEYEKEVRKMNLNSFKSLYELKEKAEKFWLEKPWREYSGNTLNVNVSGEYIFESKNSKDLYICEGVENSKYTQLVTVGPVRDSYDYSGWGNNATEIYESITVGENCSTVLFSYQCWPDCMNLEYCYWNINGKNNLGCVNLKRKDHCILNKQYTKEKYEILREKIINDMKKNPYIDSLGRKFFYGEFFPLEFSNYPFNDSNAFIFTPKTEKEAEKEGYSWKEKTIKKYNITMDSSSLPDTIEEVDDGILKEVIKCSDCERGYNIAKGELDLLRKINIPLPRKCPRCRENKRFLRLNKPKFYDRKCAKCDKDIRTAFSPDSKEIVYCEKCYQAEFI